MGDVNENARQRAYRLGCEAIPDVVPVDDRVKLLEVRYLIDCYLASDPAGLRVFDALSWRPRYEALMLARNYATGRILAKPLITLTKARLGDAYVRALRNALILSEAPPEPDYGDLEHELHLEALKAYTPLVLPEPIPNDECGRVATPASIMWFRYVDAFHALVGLPSVASLSKSLTTWSPEEKYVLALGKFDEFAIGDPEERAFYEAMLV